MRQPWKKEKKKNLERENLKTSISLASKSLHFATLYCLTGISRTKKHNNSSSSSHHFFRKLEEFKDDTMASKQTSRKGKKAWRKNVDVTEVNEGLEQVRTEVIAGLASSHIFRLDTS